MANSPAIAIGKNAIAEHNSIAIGDYVHAKNGELIIRAPISIPYADMLDLQIKCPLCSEWLQYHIDKFLHRFNDCSFNNIELSDQFNNRDDFMKLKVKCPDCAEWLVWRANKGCHHVGECRKNF